jgi:hypothetical protein
MRAIYRMALTAFTGLVLAVALIHGLPFALRPLARADNSAR